MNHTLQIEFEHRQDCSKFKKHLLKHKELSEIFDGKAERCIFLKFKTNKDRIEVKEYLLKIHNITTKYRESGVEYLYVKKVS